MTLKSIGYTIRKYIIKKKDIFYKILLLIWKKNSIHLLNLISNNDVSNPRIIKVVTSIL